MVELQFADELDELLRDDLWDLKAEMRGNINLDMEHRKCVWNSSRL